MAKNVERQKRYEASRDKVKIGCDSATGQFLAHASAYTSANSTSKESARKKLKELDIVDASGKPSKHYR